MLFADASLAARIERLDVEEMRSFVAAAQRLYPDMSSSFLDIGGGIAAHVGPAMHLSQACGLGLEAELTDDEVARIEAFYAQRGARGMAVISPPCAGTLPRRLTERGWTITDFENVLVRPLDDDLGEPPRVDGLEMVEARTDEDLEVWIQAVAFGFSAPSDPTEAQMRLARVVSGREGAIRLLAYVDGTVAGTGELSTHGGVAWLSGDTTMPAFRGRGVQRAMQHARLVRGREAGCDLAVSEASPGSISQRNQQRSGFQVAYTRIELTMPAVSLGA